MKRFLLTAASLFISLLYVPQAMSHCEVPCGIYGDEMRLDMIEEHLTTIEKAINSINELSKEKVQNYNQLVRWVDTKEKHAEEIQSIVYQYFMTQRLKPVEETNKKDYDLYTRKLQLLHQMLIFAMKTKQTTEVENATRLRTLLSDFREVYLGPASQKHVH